MFPINFFVQLTLAKLETRHRIMLCICLLMFSCFSKVFRNCTFYVELGKTFKGVVKLNQPYAIDRGSTHVHLRNQKPYSTFRAFPR